MLRFQHCVALVLHPLKLRGIFDLENVPLPRWVTVWYARV